MTVCAILVNYHGARDTAAAACSVLADAPDAEMLVVDNSGDEGESERLRARLPPSVRVLDSGRNLGFGAACNLAMDASKAEYVFLVNPDVRVLPGCVAALAAALDTHPACAAVAPRQFVDASCAWLLPPSWYPTGLGAWAQMKAQSDRRQRLRWMQATRAEALRCWTTRRVLHQRALTGGSMMLRRAALLPGESLFDPRFFMYFEDSDLCRRLKGRGGRLALVPDARIVHYWHNTAQKGPLMAAGAAAYFEKYAAVDGRWREQAATLSAVEGCGVVAEALVTDRHVPVPPAWHGGWLLELGLHPTLSPALGHMGVGPCAEVPLSVWNCLGARTAYVRLGPLSPVAIDNLKFFQLAPPGCKEM